jgi:biotin carboxylase
MSNVLLVDTNFSSTPIYKYLVASGYNVFVVGGNDKDALAKYVDQYLNCDYSNINKMLEIIKNNNIDYLVPGCNDRSYLVCSEINKYIKFPGIEELNISSIINNKKKFRDFAKNNKLSIPKVYSTKSSLLQLPVIVKPVDSYSGRGVTVINEKNKNEISIAIQTAQSESLLRNYLIEDYIDGRLYSHSAFIEDGQIITDVIVEEFGSVNQFVVDTSYVSYNFPEKILTRIRYEIETISNKLNLKNGLIHTQFILNGDQFWLIEITRRCPGDLYSQLIELSTGLNYVENYTLPFLGNKLKVINSHQQNIIIRHTITQNNDFTLGSIIFKDNIKLTNFIPLSITGEKLRSSPYGRVAIFFAEMSSQVMLKKILKKILSRNLYLVS